MHCSSCGLFCELWDANKVSICAFFVCECVGKLVPRKTGLFDPQSATNLKAKLSACEFCHS